MSAPVSALARVGKSLQKRHFFLALFNYFGAGEGYNSNNMRHVVRMC